MRRGITKAGSSDRAPIAVTQRGEADAKATTSNALDNRSVNAATVRAFEAGDDGLELIAIGSDRPDGGDGVFVDPAWID